MHTFLYYASDKALNYKFLADNPNPNFIAMKILNLARAFGKFFELGARRSAITIKKN